MYMIMWYVVYDWVYLLVCYVLWLFDDVYCCLCLLIMIGGVCIVVEMIGL